MQCAQHTRRARRHARDAAMRARCARHAVQHGQARMTTTRATHAQRECQSHLEVECLGAATTQVGAEHALHDRHDHRPARTIASDAAPPVGLEMQARMQCATTQCTRMHVAAPTLWLLCRAPVCICRQEVEGDEVIHQRGPVAVGQVDGGRNLDDKSTAAATRSVPARRELLQRTAALVAAPAWPTRNGRCARRASPWPRGPGAGSPPPGQSPAAPACRRQGPRSPVRCRARHARRMRPAHEHCQQPQDVLCRRDRRQCAGSRCSAAAAAQHDLAARMQRCRSCRSRSVTHTAQTRTLRMLPGCGSPWK